MAVDLVRMSRSSRVQLCAERIAQYRRATTRDDRELCRIKFYCNIGKNYDFNTRMTNHLWVARPPQGVSAVDEAFENTVADTFALVPVPIPRKVRTK